MLWFFAFVLGKRLHDEDDEKTMGRRKDRTVAWPEVDGEENWATLLNQCSFCSRGPFLR